MTMNTPNKQDSAQASDRPPSPASEGSTPALDAGRLPEAPLAMPTQTIEGKPHGLSQLRDILGLNPRSAGV